jgi:hypothetical protein
MVRYDDYYHNELNRLKKTRMSNVEMQFQFNFLWIQETRLDPLQRPCVDSDPSLMTLSDIWIAYGNINTKELFMKTSIRIFTLLILCLILAGCYIQSVHPFYLPKMVINLPEISGDWRVIRHGEGYIQFAEYVPWRFDGNSVEIVDDKGVRSRIKTVYFKVANTIFLDSTATDPDEQGGLGKYWVAHVYPVHLLCKVIIEGDTLTLIPLDYGWFEKNAKKLKNKIPFLEADGALIFSATSRQWESFLKKYKDAQGVFDEGNSYILKRVKDIEKDTPEK